MLTRSGKEQAEGSRSNSVGMGSMCDENRAGKAPGVVAAFRLDLRVYVGGGG